MNALNRPGLIALLWLAGCANMAEHSAQSPNPSPHDNGAAALAAPAQVAHAGEAAKPQAAVLVARAPTSIAAALPDPVAAGVQANLEADQHASSRAIASLSPPRNIWERIRNGYAMPDLDIDLVHDREQWYAGRPDYIYRMTERSKKYLFHIVEELELRNMPTELALLPFVESAFNPQAVSGAKAAGMWQFMPATGRSFELKQNVFRDDRRDVLASTRAALDYLQKLYGMFGDWHLALAAYNWGEGSVKKAIHRNLRAGLPAGYTDISMPMETRLYVPKLQAIKNIVAQPDQFSSSLPDIGNHPYFDTVTIRRDIDVALAAKLAEVPMEDFKALNPSVNKPVILAAGTPQILLPWDNAKVFQSNLDAYNGPRLASWTVWVAPATMRAADAARKVGMPESEFRSVNNIPPRMMIRPGSALLVPRGTHGDRDVTSLVADTGQVSLTPEAVLKKIVVHAGKGATVVSIAQKYKLSAASVAQWNNLPATASFKNKQAVTLYLPSTAAGKPAGKTAVAKQGSKASKKAG